MGPERAEEIKKDEDDFMNNVEAIPVTRKAYRIKVTLLGKMPERLERDLEKAYGKKADEQPA